MDYKNLTQKERCLILDLAELAIGGDKEALENLREITGINIKTVADAYRIMRDVYNVMPKKERVEDHIKTKERMFGDVPTKPQPNWGGYRPGAGRPSLPNTEIRKTKSIKFSDSEWEKIKELAKESGVSASEYIRSKALEGENNL